MDIEYEVRVLEINTDEIISKLESLGAEKIGEWHQKRFVYDFTPARENEWIRLRTNGIESTICYKNVEKNTIDGTKELEIVVDDFNKANELLKILGYNPRAFQENKRIKYILNEVEIDLDSWPLIPTYMEVEGKNSEKVNNILSLLEVDKEKITALNCQDIYTNLYGIDIDSITELKF